MDTNVWCAISHIDFRPSFADRGTLIAAVQAGKGLSFEKGEQVLRVLVAAGHPPGTVNLAVLQQLNAANHFQVIGRFSCEAAYEAHRSSDRYKEARPWISPGTCLSATPSARSSSRSASRAAIGRGDIPNKHPTRKARPQPSFRERGVHGRFDHAVAQVALQRAEPHEIRATPARSPLRLQKPSKPQVTASSKRRGKLRGVEVEPGLEHREGRQLALQAGHPPQHAEQPVTARLRDLVQVL